MAKKRHRDKKVFFFLSHHAVCGDGYKYVQTCKKHTLEDAWNTCERGDWMLYVLGLFNYPVGQLTDGIKKRFPTIRSDFYAHTASQIATEDTRSMRRLDENWKRTLRRLADYIREVYAIDFSDTRKRAEHLFDEYKGRHPDFRWRDVSIQNTDLML